MDRKRKKSRKKKKILLYIAIVFLLILLLLIAILCIFSFYYSKLNIQRIASNETKIQEPSLNNKENTVMEQALSKETDVLPGSDTQEPNVDVKATEHLTESDKNEEVRNILLIGVDNDYLEGIEQRGNADGLVLLSINQNTKKIVMTSLLRDIDVPLDNGGHTKLTLAYPMGGTQLLVDVIEKNFDIPIDNYVLVNYLNIIEIVDAFGGIQVDVTEDELYWMQEKIYNLNILTQNEPYANIIPQDQSGVLNLNGIQTVAYMRIRYAGNGDYERTDRIRVVVMQLKEKARHMSLSELKKMADIVLPCIQTDLSAGDLLSLIANSFRYLKYEMVSNRVPIDGSFYETESVGSEVIVDFSVNREYLQRVIYEGQES